ncbi:MAG: tRNA lysidine(34) synthetase TilS [Chloroflexi bacterium]|nr:tRNA lysidine(34) synthetase TilS [Chloroflexota bacterium]
MSFREQFADGVEAGLEAAGVDFGRRLLVAFSGGGDSTALLLACNALRAKRGLKVAAAHFNHRLRGAESDEDARFAETFCRETGIECITGSADVAAHRDREQLSIEEAARELRYGFLARAAAERDAQAVATGHTLDDQAETVLLHLVRGSGLAGLAGMRPSHMREAVGAAPAVRVVRPMLNLRHADAEGFCAEHGVEPRLDRSNADLRHPRNRLRHVVLPELATINPRAIEAIVRLSSHVRAELDLIDRQVDMAWRDVAVSTGGNVRLRRECLRALPDGLLPHVLRRLYESVTGNTAQLELVHVEHMTAAALGRVGATVDLPRDLRMEIGYDRVSLLRPEDDGVPCPYPPSVEQTPLPVPGRVCLGAGFGLAASVEAAPANLCDSSPWVSFLDPAVARTPLVVRSRRPGDRFQPLGMAVPKRLQDFFVDERVPRAWRDRVPLVETERGIVWVAGRRPAEWARLPAGARRALRLELTRPV